MSSTDEPRDDGERGEEPIDESVLPPGPRRSTYTPPVQRQPPSPTTDDDELADVIAANLASATGSINVIYQLDDITPSMPMGAPIEQLAKPDPDARILPKDAPKAEPVDVAPPAAATPPPAPAAPVAASMPSPDASAVPADLPPPPEFDAPSVPFGAPPVAPADEPFDAPPPPVEPEPAVVFDLDAEPPTPAPVAPGPVEPEPVEPEPVEPEPVEPEPVEPEPVEPEPVAPEPVEPAPVPEPVMPEPVIDEPFAAEPAVVDPSAAEPSAAEPESVPAPVAVEPDPAPFEPVAWEPEPWEPEAPDEVGNAEPSAAEAPIFEVPVLPPDAPAEPFDQAAFLAASAAPAGQRPWIPERQSLRDDELAALIENGTEHPGGTLGAMEELERQMQLREEEKREFSEWQESMLAVGTPEALAAVDDVLPAFSDLVAPSTSSVPVQKAPAFDAPPPAFDAPRLDAPPPPFDAPPPPTDTPPRAFAPPPPFDAPRSDAPPPPLTAATPEPADIVEAEPVFDDDRAFDDQPVVEPVAPAAAAPIDEIPAFAAPVEPPTLVEPPVQAEPPAMPDAWDIPSGTAIPDSEADPIFIEPVPAEPAVAPQPLVEPSPFGGDPFVDRVFTGSIPVVTGSVPIAPQQLDVDDDDPVDATDQIPASFDDLLGPNPGTAPVEPILSPRIPEDEVVLGEAQQLERPRVFSLESAGLEPTPEEQRVGRAARMFWMWFAANSSIVSIAFGAVLFSVGISLRQAIVGILAGVAVSFLPLGLGTLAGKRSGQPTMVVSRAAFGVVGNGVPALVAFVSRVFWGAAMLWVLGSGLSEILVGAESTGGIDSGLLTLIGIAAGFALALIVALFGYGLLAKFQLVVSVISGILVVGVIALTAGYVDLATALTNRDGSWVLAGTVAVLVFSFIGLLWANSSADLARYQRPGSSGAGAMLWTTFGAAVPTFVLISYGALLAASNEQIAEGLLTLPFDTIGRLLPVWYPVPLIAALALSLLSGVVVTVYSGGFALKAVGLSLGRPVAAVVTALLVAAGAVLLTTMAADFSMLFRDLATTLAVPVAAWAGIFAADTMIRNRRYHSDSLLRRGGIYPTVHWVNLPAFLVITAVGFGLTTASVAGLTWQGFLWPLLGIALDAPLAGTDLGVFAALLLGLLVPIVAGIPGIRRQEAAKPAEPRAPAGHDGTEN